MAGPGIVKATQLGNSTRVWVCPSYPCTCEPDPGTGKVRSVDFTANPGPVAHGVHAKLDYVLPPDLEMELADWQKLAAASAARLVAAYNAPGPTPDPVPGVVGTPP